MHFFQLLTLSTMNAATVKHDLAIEFLEDSKKAIVDNIFADDKLSIIEKLTLISRHDLLPFDHCINHIVPEEKFEAELRAKYPNKSFFIIDEISFAERQRHERIDMANEVECVLENLSYENEDKTEEELMELDIDVLSCRGGIEDIFKMKAKNYIQLIYDWVKASRKIGFVLDW